MTNELITRTLAFVKGVFENDFSGHDFFHTLRVFRMATKIAIEEGGDCETVQLAALLHDVDDAKLSPHTYRNKDTARRFLCQNGVDAERIAVILEIIGEVAYIGRDSRVPKTREGKCVQDADRLDAIGAIGIARAFMYGGSHHRPMHCPDSVPKTDMNEEEYRKSESATVNHFYEKLFLLTDMMNTDTAKAIAVARDRYMRDYIDEFLAEWDGIR